MTVPTGSADPVTTAAVPATATASVDLAVPAEVGFVGLVRTVAANLGARCSLTVDEIEDVRIAVDETVALLIALAADGAQVHASFDVGADRLGVAVDVDAAPGATVDRTGFGWTVLEALAQVTEVRTPGDAADAAGGIVGITMVKVAEEAVPGTDPTAPAGP